MVLGTGMIIPAQAEIKKPPRPERIEEILSDRPSEFHTWISGRWKWKKKVAEWTWKSGYWKFDHNLYAWKNRFNHYGSYYYRPYRMRYYAIPIGGGYYRIIAY